MKNKLMLTVNTLFITVIFVLNYFYQSNGFDFTLKCICSVGFALQGLINFGYALHAKQQNMRFCGAMLLGLFLAMLGDILIGYNFIVGAGVFAVGHIFFVIAYSFLHKIDKLDIAIGGGIFLCALIFLLFFPHLSFDSSLLKAVCIAYALIISLMLGKALSNFLRKKDFFHSVLAIGSTLFFISDLMLVLDQFVGLWSWTNEACMGTYYPALCLLAFSIYINKKD